MPAARCAFCGAPIVVRPSPEPEPAPVACSIECERALYDEERAFYEASLRTAPGLAR